MRITPRRLAIGVIALISVGFMISAVILIVQCGGLTGIAVVSQSRSPASSSPTSCTSGPPCAAPSRAARPSDC